MTNLIFLYSKILLHWGFIVRHPGTSAAQPAYIVPPPTTVVGAFANPLARLLDLSDAIDAKRKMPVSNKLMSCALKSTLFASAGVYPSPANTGVIVFEEPSRIMGTPYKGGGSYEKAVKQPIYHSVQELLPVQAVGSASGPRLEMGLVWLFDKDHLEDCLGMGVSFETLEKVTYNIYRVGSREGLANLAIDDRPRMYTREDFEIRDMGVFSSWFYQDAECAKPVYATNTVEVTLLARDYSEKIYYLPASPGSGPSILIPPSEPVPFKLRSGCKIIYPKDSKELAVSFKGD